jgi:glutamine amidotransferase-like uncharacterized protein
VVEGVGPEFKPQYCKKKKKRKEKTNRSPMDVSRIMEVYLQVLLSKTTYIA